MRGVPVAHQGRAPAGERRVVLVPERAGSLVARARRGSPARCARQCHPRSPRPARHDTEDARGAPLGSPRSRIPGPMGPVAPSRSPKRRPRTGTLGAPNRHDVDPVSRRSRVTSRSGGRVRSDVTICRGADVDAEEIEPGGSAGRRASTRVPGAGGRLHDAVRASRWSRSTGRGQGDAVAGFERIGWPGEFPFTRGLYPTGYRGRTWTIRQFAGFGNAAADQRALQDDPRPPAAAACRWPSTCRP